MSSQAPESTHVLQVKGVKFFIFGEKTGGNRRGTVLSGAHVIRFPRGGYVVVRKNNPSKNNKKNAGHNACNQSTQGNRNPGTPKKPQLLKGLMFGSRGRRLDAFYKKGGPSRVNGRSHGVFLTPIRDLGIRAAGGVIDDQMVTAYFSSTVKSFRFQVKNEGRQREGNLLPR